MNKFIWVIVAAGLLFSFRYFSKTPVESPEAASNKITQTEIKSADPETPPTLPNQAATPPLAVKPSPTHSPTASTGTSLVTQPETEPVSNETPESRKNFLNSKELAKKKLSIPISEELKNAKIVTKFTHDNFKNFGFLPSTGDVTIDGKKFFVVMAVSWNSLSEEPNPYSCLAMYGPTKTVFFERYDGGKLKYLKTSDEGYLIISIADKYYFQIFRNRTHARNPTHVNLTVPGKVAPYQFEFHHDYETYYYEGAENCLRPGTSSH